MTFNQKLLVNGVTVGLVVIAVAVILFGGDRLAFALVAVLLLTAAGLAVGLMLSVRRLLVPQIEAQLKLAAHVRLTMEDLRSRDPQLDEVLSIALLEVDEWERSARSMIAELLVRRGGRTP